MTVIIKGSNGKSSSVNLSKHSWETDVVPGDDTMIELTLDNGKKFTLQLDKYEEILSKLEKESGFMVL